MMLQPLPCALVGDRRKRHEDVSDDQHHSRPLRTDDDPLAMMESCGVCRMPTGTMLARALQQEGDLPGQTCEALSRVRNWLGSTLGKLRSRREGNVGVVF